MNENLKGTTTLGQSGPGSNSNERVLHTPHISGTETSSSVAVLCYFCVGLISQYGIQSVYCKPHKIWQNLSLSHHTITVLEISLLSSAPTIHLELLCWLQLWKCFFLTDSLWLSGRQYLFIYRISFHDQSPIIRVLFSFAISYCQSEPTQNDLIDNQYKKIIWHILLHVTS